ncbi:MAG: glutaredoxin domain-containing protein [Promethearchaeati archaeon SRVP18_Atabeyarchaeia-1]
MASKERSVKMFVETNCPSCRALKSYLNSIDVKYVESSIDDADNKVDALMLNIYSVPALVKGNDVLRANEIFDSGNSLRKEQITRFVGK